MKSTSYIPTECVPCKYNDLQALSLPRYDRGAMSGAARGSRNGRALENGELLGCAAAIDVLKLRVTCERQSKRPKIICGPT
jgi:hypothetical protein